MPKVSVIIPIYKVERFIGRCAESLMRQTLQDVEFVFVDDATPDGSVQVLNGVLNKYPERKKHVKIVRHESNKGLPAARNTGLAAATGDYVFHCDSDDYAADDMLEVLYNQAVEKQADIVWCDWFLSFEHKERYMRQPSFDSAVEAIKAMLAGKMKYNVWNKLVRRDLYKEVCFPSGYSMGEDMTMILLFAKANIVKYAPRAFYHYVKSNTNALSHRFVAQHLVALKHNVEQIEASLRSQFGNSLDLELACLKLEIKYPFLVTSANSTMYRLWQSTYPEANAFILKNKYVSLRSRIVQWCASKNMWFIVRLHFYLVCRLMYGVIYK